MDCNSCDGSGKAGNWIKGIGRARPCPACKGIGKKHVVPCHHCGGRGRVPFVRELRVTIPSGVDTGDRLRLAGQGVPGRNSSPGDLFVTTLVQEHPRFKRQKKDLICCAILDALDVMEWTT
jgi:molecular chaperone DnaJ